MNEEVTPTTEELAAQRAAVVGGAGGAQTLPPAPAEGLAGPIQDIDPEKLKALEERLKAFKENQGKTISGSENPDAPATFPLDQFEVDPELEHFYKRSMLEDTDEGPKWVVLEHQYHIASGAWHLEGSGQAYTKNKQGKTLYRAKGLDHIITEMVNGPDGMLTRKQGWRLSALLPGGGMGQGVAVFERQVKRSLPDPKPIVKPEEQPLEKTTDEELARMQERAKEWSGDAGTAGASADAKVSAAEIGVVEAGTSPASPLTQEEDHSAQPGGGN